MVAGWDIIHVFEYDETQIIGDVYNGSCITSRLITFPPLVTYLNSIAPVGTVINSATLSTLNLYCGEFIDFFSAVPAASNSFRFEWVDLTSMIEIDNFVNEIITLI